MLEMQLPTAACNDFTLIDMQFTATCNSCDIRFTEHAKHLKVPMPSDSLTAP